MTDDWEARVDAFWAQAGRDDSDIEAILTGMKVLVAERPPGDPDATFEWASVHDFLGREREAIRLYREALDGGLDGARRPKAIIQLASSLRNDGQPDAAIRLLHDMEPSHVIGDAQSAFLALALFDAGRPDEALRVALEALATTLPLYGSSVARYAAELAAED